MTTASKTVVNAIATTVLLATGAWAANEPADDDSGNVAARTKSIQDETTQPIPEEESTANKRGPSRAGRALGRYFLGSIAAVALIASCLGPGAGPRPSAIEVVHGAAVLVVCYVFGPARLRERAIEHTRQQRRREKDLCAGWDEMPTEPHIPLIAVAF